MKTFFEENELVLSKKQSIIMPPKGTLIWINKVLYEVDYCVIYLDKNKVTVEVIEIK